MKTVDKAKKPFGYVLVSLRKKSCRVTILTILYDNTIMTILNNNNSTRLMKKVLAIETLNTFYVS